MAILIGFIGCALHWDLKFAKKKEDTSITTENIIGMLKKHGITDIEAKDEGIIFRLEGSLYTLDYKFQPIIRFGSVSVMEDDIDRDIAKIVAEEFNKEFFNANVEVDDGRPYYITCMTFADDLKDLFNALPSMKQYLETANYHYLKRLQKCLLQPNQLRHSQDTKD